MKSGKYRLRKTSDISQTSAIYEVVDEEQRVLIDVTRSDQGVYEACLMDNEGVGRVIELQQLLDLVLEAQRRIESDT